MTGAAIQNDHAREGQSYLATGLRGNQRVHESLDRLESGFHPLTATDGMRIAGQSTGDRGDILRMRGRIGGCFCDSTLQRRPRTLQEPQDANQASGMPDVLLGEQTICE